jgi:hypothetical protein
MRPLVIKGHTRILGKSQGYLGLPIRDSNMDGAAVMESLWEPTPAELEKIVCGAPVLLWVMGTIHPPVLIGVGEPPSEADET